MEFDIKHNCCWEYNIVGNIFTEKDVGVNDDGNGLDNDCDDDCDGLDNDYDDDCDDDVILGQVAQWGAGQSDSCL